MERLSEQEELEYILYTILKNCNEYKNLAKISKEKLIEIITKEIK